jgi:serine/threonine protein kinase
MGACLSDLCNVDERPPHAHAHRAAAPAAPSRTHLDAPQKSSSSRESPGKPRTHRDAGGFPHGPATVTSRPPHAPAPADQGAAAAQPAGGHLPPALSWAKGALIGAGAFGRVYQGLNTGTGELIAVKQVGLSKDEAASRQVAEHVRALEAEVALLRTLRHENIVQYLGVERTADAVNILLEFVPGGSIASILQKFGPLTEGVIQIYTRQILSGLDYLHQQGIIHRDIKGANILIDNKGTIKLADFGASKRIENLATIAGANSVRGTPYWMAPEVIKAQKHGRPADIWSLACTVIEMATGKPPWSNYAAPVSAMFQIAQASAPPPFPATLSRDAHDFLALCFSRVPSQRPNAAKLLEHPFIANAPARPASCQAPQQQQQQQQHGPPRLQAPHQQLLQPTPPGTELGGSSSSRLPPLAKPQAGKASRLSPTKRCPQPAQEPAAQLVGGHRPQAPLGPAAAAAAAAQQQQQQQQPGPPRPGPGAGAQLSRPGLTAVGPVAGQAPPGPASSWAQAQAQQPAAAGLPGPLGSPLTRGLGVRQSAAQGAGRPPPGSVFNSLAFNPMSEPSWCSSSAPALPAGQAQQQQQQQAAPGIPTVMEDAVLSLTSSSTAASGGRHGSSRASSRRTTVYDDDADQHAAARPGRASPRPTGRASPAAAGPSDRKLPTPRGSPRVPGPADAAAVLHDLDTGAAVDQPSRPSSTSPKRGAGAGMLAVHGVPAASAGSGMLCSKQRYIDELDVEIYQAKMAMRATMQLGRAQ